MLPFPVAELLLLLDMDVMVGGEVTSSVVYGASGRLRSLVITDPFSEIDIVIPYSPLGHTKPTMSARICLMCSIPKLNLSQTLSQKVT